MNSITGILIREKIQNTDKINVLWTPSDNMIFEQAFKKLKHNTIGFDHLYFGKDTPQVIICNNKILYYEKCKNISIQFHIPVLLIDHAVRPKELSEEEVNLHKYELPSSYKIAMNEKIAASWGGSYHKILTKEDITDTDMFSFFLINNIKLK